MKKITKSLILVLQEEFQMKRFIKKSLSIFIMTILCCLFAVAVSAEAGNDYSSAQSISTNKAYSDNIQYNDDQDWYKFKLTANGNVSINFKRENFFSDLIYWRAYIYDENLNWISEYYFYGNETETNTYKVGLKAGTYYVKIDDNYHTDRTYTFKVNYSKSNYWEKENNETYSAANTISLNEKYNGSLRNGNDQDWYKFKLTANGNVSINFKRENFFSDLIYWRAYIYDENLNWISEYYFYGNETETNTYKVGLKAGTYYVKIDDNYHTDRTYTFKVNYSKSNYWEKENNETYSVANTISLNEKYNGSIRNWNDQDWYKFKLTKKTALKLYFYNKKTESSSRYYYFKIYDSKANLISSYDISGNSGTNKFSLTLSKGTYYVQVICSSYYKNDTYGFRISDGKPGKITDLSATQTTTTITLKWSKVTDADGYAVYKYNSKTEKYEKVKSVTGTSLKISELKAGTTYKFKVRAYKKDNGTIYGSYSSVLTTATKPAAPTLKLTSTTKGKVNASWTNVSGETGYQLYYSTSKDGEYKKVAAYKANVVKGSKSELTSKKTYYFKVRAYKKVDGKTIYGAWSSVMSIKIK